MKLKNIYTKIFCAAVMSAAAVSCDFLDVAPPKRADLTDGMKNKSMVENWIFGGYSYIAENDPIIFTRYEGSTDEYVTPDLWSEHDRQKVAYGLLNASNVNDYTWRATYGSIGNIHLFLRELESQNPEFLTESDKNLYRAHAHFLKAYYYFKLLSMFGPFAIVDEYMPTDTPRDQFPGRSHFDYCVDYIISELDAACSYDEFPSGYAMDETYGRGNRTVCAAIKSRLLLYAASPLWNGSFPYPDWKNTDRDKLKETLEILAKEDPTFQCREDAETGQIVISGMGELHLEVLVTRMLEDFKLEARVGAPQVTYRESVTAAAEYTEHFAKTIGGKETSAGVTLRVEPVERGGGNRFVNAVKKTDAPEEMMQAVENAVRSALSSGIRYGYGCGYFLPQGFCRGRHEPDYPARRTDQQSGIQAGNRTGSCAGADGENVRLFDCPSVRNAGARFVFDAVFPF